MGLPPFESIVADVQARVDKREAANDALTVYEFQDRVRDLLIELSGDDSIDGFASEGDEWDFTEAEIRQGFAKVCEQRDELQTQLESFNAANLDMKLILERIAVALEKLSGVGGEEVESCECSETLFPWGDESIDSRLRNIRNWTKWGVLKSRPESFEKFIKIGRSALMSGMAGTSNIGKVSIEKLDHLFVKFGFGDAWMKS